MDEKRPRLRPLSRRTALPAVPWIWRVLEDGMYLGVLFAGSEWAGRLVKSDWQAFLVFALTALIWGPLFFHRSASPAVKASARLWAFLGRGLRARLRIDFGFDFRPTGLDPRFHDLDTASMLFMLIGIAATAFSPLLLPGVSALQAVSGLLFLAVVGLLWILLLSTALLAAVSLIAFYQATGSQENMHRNPASGNPKPRRRWKPALEMAVVVASLIGLEILFGSRGVFAALVLMAILHFTLAFMPRRGALPALLVRRGGLGPMRSSGLFRFEHASLGASAVWAMLLFLSTAGPGPVPEAASFPAALEAGPSSFIWTAFLGRAVAFLALLFLVPITARSIRLNVSWLRNDPARPRNRTLAYVPGKSPGPAPAPWRFVPFRGAPTARAADLDYDPDGNRADRGTAPPLRRTLENLQEAERLFLLNHFDFITKRRDFYRGLSRILKAASGHRFESGGGYLLSPHYFFIEGMHRDDPGGEEGEARYIGPPFSGVWCPRTRRFLYEMLNSLEVDLVFFEDAVKWPRLRLVLDRLFERFMQTPEAGPVQESDFHLLQGVRVFIDLLEPEGTAKKREGYEEPHFANLSRARVLMVFKDRGGELEDAERPNPRVRVPVPLFG